MDLLDLALERHHFIRLLQHSRLVDRRLLKHLRHRVAGFFCLPLQIEESRLRALHFGLDERALFVVEMQLLRLRHDQLRREELLADRIIVRRRCLSVGRKSDKRGEEKETFNSGVDCKSSRPGVCSRKSVGAFHAVIDGCGFSGRRASTATMIRTIAANARRGVNERGARACHIRSKRGADPASCWRSVSNASRRFMEKVSR